MRLSTHTLAAVLLGLLLVSIPTAAQPQSPSEPPPAPVRPELPEPQREFRPISELPRQDQLPAAPLLIAAYSFVGVALFVYVWSISRRLGVVKREIERLDSDLKRSGRA